MSTTSRLDQLTSEIYGIKEFTMLTKFEQELITSLYKLDDMFDHTDFELIEWDNIHE